MSLINDKLESIPRVWYSTEHYFSSSNISESWLSGRKHLTANEAGFKRPHGFKSHTLRNCQLQHVSVAIDAWNEVNTR